VGLRYLEPLLSMAAKSGAVNYPQLFDTAWFLTSP
jgi:hypothetical protein